MIGLGRPTAVKIPLLLLCALAMMGFITSASSALAATPVWSVTSGSAPTVLAPGDNSGTAKIFVRAVNVGAVSTEAQASPATVSVELPAGVNVSSVVGFERWARSEATASCVAVPVPSCSVESAIPPYASVEMQITVDVDPNAASGTAEVKVVGGGAAKVSLRSLLRIGMAPAGFGVEDFALTATNEDGSPDTQAGSHPYALTTDISLNQKIGVTAEGGYGEGAALSPLPAALPKDLQFDLPPGVVGNPTVLPQCTIQKFTSFGSPSSPFFHPNECGSETAIGVADVAVTLGAQEVSYVVPLFNLVPQVGEPARFGFDIRGAEVYLDTAVRTGSDYGVRVDVSNITQIVGFEGAQVTIWGTPGDASHNASRGWNCLAGGFVTFPLLPPCATNRVEEHPTPFLTLPTSCTGPLTSMVDADSWEEPGKFDSASATLLQDSSGNPIGLDGCSKLHFDPQVTVAPDGTAANTPSGLNVDVHVPQEEDLANGGLSEAEVKTTSIAFPEGIAVSPGGADGLEACSLAQIGLEENAEPSCPEASKVGIVEIDTPLLPNPLKGSLYLAQQNANPFGSLLAAYIVAKDPVSGVLVKLAGKVTPNELTGQLTSTFENTPQLPFSDLKVDLFGGSRAPFTTPPLCGTYTTHATIAPWSGTPAAEPTSSFPITSGPNGAPCSNPQPFNPGFASGTTNLQASAFTPFTLTMSRPDADQTLASISLRMPAGLLGMLSSVKLCPEPQAAQGTCGAESLIGHTTISAGLGNNPITVVGGKVYITTGYKGAPYGLSIVNPAVAGPFNLGTVVVRASVNVDPHTAALSVQSDPLPTILDGIPLQLQHVNVTIDRPGFTFNPTNCSQMPITATLSSSLGATAAVSSPFQVTNCATLKFAPRFTVSIAGHTSKAIGESLTTKLTYPAGSLGSQANVSRVKVALPIQLPSQLTTLQRACLAAVFEADPANCPPESVVGRAKVITPLLPVPLTGPAYFVSHGGEELPSLIVVLQGYGVTIDLVGTTKISKQITSTTFKTAPDTPFSSFELTLPQGKYAALGVNLPNKDRGSFCGQKLKMPTELIAQNGLEIHQNTPISVSGCPKGKAAKKAKTAKRRHAANASQPRPAKTSPRSK